MPTTPSSPRVRLASLLVFLLVTVARAPAAPEGGVTEEQEVRGAELYSQHCQSCHGGPTGGSPTDFPPRHNAQGHTWHHGDCELIRWTLEGKPSFEATGTTMPAFTDRLSEDDVRAILAHIRTWWTDEQQEAQAEVTEGLCE